MRPKKVKAFGQHFLKNPHALRKIITSISPQKDDLIIEVGPGKGVLTFPLAANAGRIIAIEKDRDFAEMLKARDIQNLIILENDVLDIDLTHLVSKEKKNRKQVKIVGNLPYSISTPFLFKVYESRELFSFCIFMIQKEVAERLCSAHGSKKYAPISILFQNAFEIKILLRLGPRSFQPRPKVDSALISLKPREEPLFSLQDEQGFRRFLKGAFQSRRKTLPNNLLQSGYTRTEIENALSALQIDKTIRPEQLSPGQFNKLFLLMGAFPKK